ncbi:KN motif and ankyrin repeat domain-containing protein 2 isoform X1 [Stomoxys calcitrans]|uniref:KN motif and ankyrin repeat domain-containing protein 2 isoform X1 n=1 Tax=Stomoxys calcitrans TaxID=35570 RepID=UPI0027E3118F|nr:KN motif and ankyrin repeat domain-containing protein 2 isoform X1 [Stomoxys calcitrans]
MLLDIFLFFFVILWHCLKYERALYARSGITNREQVKLLRFREIPEICCNLPQYANVRSCNCCPYGYHIDLDFVRYCESLANAKPSEEELQRRSRRRSRKSMEFMLGLDSIFDQWDAIDKQQTLTELPHENEPDSPFTSLQRTPSFTSTPYQYQATRPRSSSVPRFGSTTPTPYPRSESPYGTASSTCSSYRGAESDNPPYPLRRPPMSPPETKAFLRDALDEVCSDFEKTLERTSMKRKKTALRDDSGGGRFGRSFPYSSDRNNNNHLVKGLSYNYQDKRYNGWSWDTTDNGHDVGDSCIAGQKSPRTSRFYTKPLPFQQKLSPAEQQYESYVKATVAANAKSPMEELLLGGNGTAGQSTPPAPPPRKQSLVTSSVTSPISPMPQASAENSSSSTSPDKPQLASQMPTTESLPSPAAAATMAATAAAAATDAQTLFNIRQQMALSLKRMKDLEEQVKTIPDLQSELTQLRDDKQRLQQTVQRKEEELQKAKEANRFSSSPSPSPKITSPIQFQPQRVSPISLESMGTRLRSSSTSSDRASKSPPSLKRDVGTMYSKHTTRDIAVGSPLPIVKTTRDVACNSALTANITESLYTRIEMEEHIYMSMRQYEEQKKLERLKDLISVGTQMYTPKKDVRDSSAQTRAERPVPKYNVGIMAQPATRESYTNCKPDVRSVGCSNDRITDVLCEKCLVTKHHVACGTEEPGVETTKSISLKLLEMPGRSNTFTLGEHEKLNIQKKTQWTQYTPITVHSAACQTPLAVVHSVGLQFSPEMQSSSTQAEVDMAFKLTDTRDLIRWRTSQTNTEEMAPPTPSTPKETKLQPPKPILFTKACNTEMKSFKDNAVNTPPPATTSNSASNTEEVHKRDIACGDIVKPHISIACADNYCDSCKDAIKNLAKDFSKVLASPVPSRAAESKIPRPKTLPSPTPQRRVFQRQNTYTVTPSPPSSPVAERKNLASSLQEKPAAFHQLDSAGESQSFITEQVSAGKSKLDSEKLTEEDSDEKTTESPGASPQRKSLYDLSHLGDNELIVREEKRISISWSRDNSPAPAPAAAAAADQPAAKPNVVSNAIDEKPAPPPAKTEECEKAKESAPPCMAEISQGARKKTTTSLLPSPIKSSQVKTTRGEEESTKEEQKPPSKALLQKIAMKETEPRKKATPPMNMLVALKSINNSLLKKMGAKPISSLSLKTSKQIIQQEWFRVSSSENANPLDVEDYLDCFEELSVPLLEHCVNMVDANGNTAMHYAVSHCNFDVVSILLDSKVCNVNQMNNAGYTSVMLVSLAKLKNAEHRTVVERLFQMADVNIRAKKHCQTALMLAVSHGNLEMVQLLLANGADINIQDEDGSTALMCAAEHGRSDIVKHLLTHPDCDSLIQDADGSTAFKIAWQAGHRDIGVFLYVHEQMLRSKMPNRPDTAPVKHSPPAATSPRYTHKRQPSK